MQENIFLSVITGILSSLVASIVWLYFFSRLRPNIAISPQIAKFSDSQGNIVYKIKIINKGHRPIVDVRVKLVVSTHTNVPGGTISVTKNIPLKVNEVMGIAEFNRKDGEALYAYRFVIYEDLETLWQNDRSTSLSFRLYAIDSLSGLGKYFYTEYRAKRTSIVGGDFEFGNSFKIL